MASKYSVTIAALDKYSAPLQSFSKASDKLVTKIKGQRAELRNLNAAASDLQGLDRLKRGLSETSGALEKARLKESALKSEHTQLASALRMNSSALDAAKQKHFQLALQIQNTENPTREMMRAHQAAANVVKELEKGHKGLNKQLEASSKNLDKNKNETVKLSAEHRSQSIKLGQLERSLTDAGVDAHKFAEEQKRIKHASEQANAALKTQQARLKSVSDAQSRVDSNRATRANLRGQVLETAAIGYIAAQPIKAAINYESAMADVKKVVNFTDDSEANQMGRDILTMSTKIPIAADGIAQIVSAAGQSGIAKAELLDFATSAAKMATAFDVSADDAGKTMAAWRASMGLSQSQAVALADATNHLSNNMNAQAKDIAGVLKRQGAVAMSAGLNETQTASLSAALLSGGAGEEVAATALKNITGALMKGDSATKSQRTAWAELGFDPTQLAYDMTQNAPDTMIRVFESMQEVPQEQVSALVSSLFGEEVKGSVMPLLKNLDNLRNAFKMTADAALYQGSMEAEYQSRSATTANNLQLLSAKFNRIGVTVGSVLLPPLNTFADGIGWVADGIGDFAERFPTLTKYAATAGLTLVGLATGLTALRYLKALIMQPFNILNLGRAKMAATSKDTARNATLANRALQRLNATMASMSRRRSPIGSNHADLGGQGRGRRGGRGRRKLRMRGGGKWGRMAGLMTGGTALSLMSSNANAGDLAMMGADVSGLAGDLFGALGLKGATKLFKPLDLMLSGAGLVSAISNGDSEEIGATAGDITGGLGGAMAGGAAGAAIGSVVPIIGTAVGGVLGSIIGGLGGGALGEWAGGKIGSWFGDDEESTDRIKPAQVSEIIKDNDRINGVTDRLPSPEKVQQQVSSNHSRQIVFSPSITLPQSSGNQEADQRLVDQVIERLKAEFIPLMSGDDLEIRVDASLMDNAL